MKEETYSKAREINWTRRWYRRARITDDPVGDLIADMRREDDAPRLLGNIGDMRSYLRSKGACREALATVPAAWRRYRGFMRRHPFAAYDPAIDDAGR